MPGAAAWRRSFVCIAVATLGACGGGDGGVDAGGGGGGGGGADDSGHDVDALVRAFDREAADAYEAEGRSRTEEWTEGVVVDDCFVVGQDGAEAIVEALGVDLGGPPVLADSFLSGRPGKDEATTCQITGQGGDAEVWVQAGTTDLDRDDVLEQRRGLPGGESVEEVDRDAPGLPADEVIALKDDDDADVAWVGDGFFVILSVPADVADAGAGLDALPAAVDAVAAGLGVA